MTGRDRAIDAGSGGRGPRLRRIVAMLVASAAVVAIVRHGRRLSTGERVSGGILIGDAGAYDAFARAVLGRFFAGVAADVAMMAPPGGRVLEIGCGPGRLAIRLARGHALAVTGLDLDPAMVERARANAERVVGARPSFVVGDVASLAFPDGSFDVVVSTLSLHHWADPSAGLTEIARVLSPTGRAVLWDVRPGMVPLHTHPPDPVEHARGSGLNVVSAQPWRWPWPLALTRRIELVPRTALAAPPAAGRQ